MNVVVEPITDRAESVLAAAAQDAKRRGHRSLRPEHILLAMIAEGDGVACRVLRTLDVDLTALAADLQERIRPAPPVDWPDGKDGTDQPPPGLLNAAAAEARDLGHCYVGTEHLLVAMARGEGPAAEALVAHGVTPVAAATMVARLLGRQLNY
ncbi:MAG: Clp protease N-terminal domain-containing protein [Gemmatimonadales bacterium]